MSLKRNLAERPESASSARPIAAAVTDPCLQAALAAYENARLDGLCHDGAWECATAVVTACVSPEAAAREQLLQALQGLVQL